MDVAVDLISFAWDDAEWKVLLIERAHPPFQEQWALPGGFVDPEEDLIDAARRELEEETGLKLRHVFQVGAFGHPKRDPRKRVVSIAHVAVLHQVIPAKAGDDAANVQWVALEGIPVLAFDHNEIIARGLKFMQDYYRLVKHLPASGPLPMPAIHSFMDTVLAVRKEDGVN